MRSLPSKALQPRFFGGSSGSGSTRLISSTSSWPTSPIHSSPSAASKENRHGLRRPVRTTSHAGSGLRRSEEHTSELQSRGHLVCRLLLEKKKNKTTSNNPYKKNQTQT